MYGVTVESSFSALHRVSLPDGTLEPLHGHDWRVRVEFRAAALDARGMVVDFLEVRAALDDITRGLQYQDLNRHPAFAERLPTAELVAEYVCGEFVRRGLTQVRWVEITEAPGCIATYERPV